ncbi:uromodulin-like [Ambystoma mexicanum]|uniref:uromodulin-like n=1 Tax=Ambystoma mexicanum TaxID=8296 RepID=UPI0037E857C4
MTSLKIKAWLGLLVTLGCFDKGSSQCPTCASDEICNTATSTCDCDLLLYTRSGQPPTPVLECSTVNMSLTLSKCQLEKDHYNPNGLHLRDTSCTGAGDQLGNSTTATVVVSVEAREDACGNQMTMNGSHVIISNALTIPAQVLSSGIIMKNNASISFSCAYPLAMQAAMLPPLKVVSDLVAVTGPDVAGDQEPTMNLFKDEGYFIPYGPSETFSGDESLNVTVIQQNP